MVGPRGYLEATRKALFGLSLGRCYARGCAQQVMQMNGEIPVITVQIAHIRAAKRDGPRYDPAMSDDERRAFKNLILLCTFHHGSVDGKETGSDYSVKDLEAWKTEREGGLFADLSALTENDLKELLGVSVRTILSEVKEELLEQIASVEVVTGENARLLRILVAETFQRPQLDADLAASLADSSRALGHLSEIAPMLESTSYRLQELPDYAVMLSDTSRDLQILPDYVGMLERTSHALMVLPDLCADPRRSRVEGGEPAQRGRKT
jgi:hypothetical protein